MPLPEECSGLKTADFRFAFSGGEMLSDQVRGPFAREQIADAAQGHPQIFAGRFH